MTTTGPTDAPTSSATESAASAPSTTVAAYDSDGVLEVTVGTVLWFIALIVSVALHGVLRDHGYLWFIPTSAIGAGLGLVGIVYCRRRSRILKAGGRADLF